MMRRRHVICAAWTGLIAIWLAIVAPVVTQWLASQDAAGRAFGASPSLTATLCSTSALDAPRSAERAASPSSSHHAKSCGYCNLLAHHPPLARAMGADGAVLRADVPREQRATSIAHAPVRFALACPRGPPQAVS